MKYFRINNPKEKAQAAVELAVFGAILIFVLSVMIRSAFNASTGQQQGLRAMRLAMTLSHQTSKIGTVGSRNSATVIFVEDRLTIDAGKYGGMDRTPFMLSASASHTNRMLAVTEHGHWEELSVMDVFVNGKWFVFTTGGFARACLAATTKDGKECNKFYELEPKRSEILLPFPSDPTEQRQRWEENCIRVTKEYVCDSKASVCPDACKVANGGPGCSDPAKNHSVTEPSGCAILYTIKDNHPLIPDWCDNYSAGTTCPATNISDKNKNLPVEARFDLDRSGALLGATASEVTALSPDPDVIVMNGALEDEAKTKSLRSHFKWQWFLVAGVDEKMFNYEARPRRGSGGEVEYGGEPASTDIVFGSETYFSNSPFQEGVLVEKANCKEACLLDKNTFVDVDGDLELEAIQKNTPDNGDNNQVDENGVFRYVGVIDYQEGDLDMKARNPRAGFTKDLKMYSYVKDEASSSGGTYLLLQEGRLYGDGRQYIRSVQKKDQVDLIERRFQLSNNTERYCTGEWESPNDPTLKISTLRPTDWINQTNSDRVNLRVRGEWLMNNHFKERDMPLMPNPVGVCVSDPDDEAGDDGCFSKENKDKTCMNVHEDSLIIFIRSRVSDLRGRKWVTDVTTDPYMTFNTDEK